MSIAEADRARGRSTHALRTSSLLRRQPLVAHADLQGHADGGSDRTALPGSERSRHDVVAGARAPALQHQHVPVLAAGAPVPLRRPQRRDQHAARQHQLDARARGSAAIARARRRPRKDPADHPRGRQRHGHVRQRARVPGHDGPFAAARGAHDDPGAVERAREHEPPNARRSTSTTRR